MDRIRIRKAVRSDCPALMELIRGLAEYQNFTDKVTVSPEHFEASGFGDNPVWWAFVAEYDGQICGFALWYIRYSTWKGKRLYLEDFYVNPGYRRKNVGSLLFESLIREAREKGYSGMTWQVLKWNEPAIRFYRKQGAELDGECLNCSLEF